MLQFDSHILVAQKDVFGHFQVDGGEIQDGPDAGGDNILADRLGSRGRNGYDGYRDFVFLEKPLHIGDVGNNDPFVIGSDLALIVVENELYYEALFGKFLIADKGGADIADPD